MRRSLSIAIISALALGQTVCGGGDEPVSAVEISVTYPGTAAELSTNSLHFWILDPGEDGPSCSQLLRGDAGPYDATIGRLADFAVITEESESGSVDEIPRGEALVYVEGVDFVGVHHLAGCQALSIEAASEQVSVSLVKAGTFDCADPETENGAPCDDGLFCTTGETCSGGSCSGGAPRDCTHVTDQCNAESCSEELGCQPMPLPNGRPCEDGAYCTAGDTCQEGVCEPGGPRDCSAEDGVCRLGECREDLDDCVPVIDDTLSCDDGLFCTTSDGCDIFGDCDGTQVDCSIATNDCNVGSCSEAQSGACIQTPQRQGLSCDTNCTLGGTCDNGLCTGGTPQVVVTTEGPAGDATCTDFVDNDCDTLFDADDPDCQ